MTEELLADRDGIEISKLWLGDDKENVTYCVTFPDGSGHNTLHLKPEEWEDLIKVIISAIYYDFISKRIINYLKADVRDGKLTKIDVVRGISNHNEKTIFSIINRMIENGILEEIQVEQYSTKRLKVKN